MNRPVLIGIILFLFVSSFLILAIRHKSRKNTRPSAPAALQEEREPSESSQRRINAKLFFNDNGSNLLAVEDRAIPYKETLHGQALEVLDQLTFGPRTNLVSVIPPGTTLRGLFITKDGTAYADFSPELGAKIHGGSMVEINTVYSIVNTLTLNFPSIKRVQILVDGRMLETLNGHLDLSRPLKQDLSLVRDKAAPRVAVAEEPLQTF